MVVSVAGMRQYHCRLTLVIAVGHSTPSNTLYLSKSRHFQPTPVQTLDKTMNTVNGDGNEERVGVVKRETRGGKPQVFFSFSCLFIG